MLGLSGIDGSDTYVKVDEALENIVEDDVKTLNEKFNLRVSGSQKKLPHIYWMPKLHKNPTKFRFIIAAPSCSIKPLSKVLTKIFKLFFPVSMLLCLKHFH